jgi:hypothetical protein
MFLILNLTSGKGIVNSTFKYKNVFGIKNFLHQLMKVLEF